MTVLELVAGWTMTLDKLYGSYVVSIECMVDEEVLNKSVLPPFQVPVAFYGIIVKKV